MHRTLTALLATAFLALPSVAPAQDANPNVTARKAMMGLYAYNLGVLGGMAQGQMPYDADLARSAATSLFHLSRSGSARMWPTGTDATAMPGATRALPAIWENMPDFGARAGALAAATEAMMAAAGTDLASLQGAMAGLGGACGGCHQTYRMAQ